MVALAVTVLALKSSSPTSSADDEIVPTTTVVTEVTTTTVDSKAIQAAVANLLGHEGATPQQIAAVPVNTSHHAAGGSPHKGSGGSHTKH